MADAYARGTRRFGVCLASSGAGAANLLTGSVQLRKVGFRKAAHSLHMENIATEKREWREEMARRGNASDGPINRWHLYQALMETVSGETIVV